MNGQLNSNIYNASNDADIEEMQKEIDSLNTAVNDLDSKVDDVNTALNDYKSSNSNKITTKDLKSDSAEITNFTSNNITAKTITADKYDVDTIAATNAKVDYIAPNSSTAVTISALKVDSDSLKIEDDEITLKNINCTDNTKTVLSSDNIVLSNDNNETCLSNTGIETKTVDSENLIVHCITPKKVNYDSCLYIDGNTFICNEVTKGDGKRGYSTYDNICQKLEFRTCNSKSDANIRYDDCGVWADKCYSIQLGTCPATTYCNCLTLTDNELCFSTCSNNGSVYSCLTPDALKVDTVNTNNIVSNASKIEEETVNNLTVNGKLTIAEGLDLSSTKIGEIETNNASIDNLTVNTKAVINGDTELNGAVKAGSITVPDGAITAGEVCIGAKGVVIDKDKNAAFADISSKDITAENVEVDTKISASCVEAKDVVSTNTFACNFYPENITIDKDVGNLHYSYQLDTDNEGGVLVDCKTVLPKEGATGVITKYKDTEANTINADSVIYTNEKNGIKIVSNAEADKTSNAVSFDTGSNVYTVKADETGFGIYAGDEKAFGIGADNKIDLSIYKCSTDDPLTGNVVKLDKNGNLYTGSADGLSDGKRTTGNTSNTLKNTATCVSSSILYCVAGSKDCSNNLTRDINATTNTICHCCSNHSDVCCENSYSRVATSEKVTTAFIDCTTTTGNTSCKKASYEISPREIRHNTSYKDAGKEEVHDNIVMCHSPTGATFLERRSGFDDAFSWQINICDSNLRITNPSRTTEAGCVEDILRVEDGKIYTKCGEFAGGGGGNSSASVEICHEGTPISSAYSAKLCYDNSLVTNSDSITTSKSTVCKVFDGSTGTCIETTKALTADGDIENCVCYVFGHSSSGYFVDKTYYYNTCLVNSDTYNTIVCTCSISSSTPYCSCCYVYSKNKWDPNYAIYNINGSSSSKECSLSISTNVEFYCRGLQIGDDGSHGGYTNYLFLDKYNNARDLYIAEESNYSYKELNLNFMMCSEQMCCNDYCFVDLDFSSCNYKNIMYFGNCTQIIPSSVCSEDYSFSACYNAILDCADINLAQGVLCQYSDEYDSGAYDMCSSMINGTCWNIRYTGVDDCYSAECYENDTIKNSFTYCRRIDAKGKIETFSGTPIMQNITTNPITALPITNTLVPLAGTVNGNGFAFFCKGSDGVKFYDANFAIVDAGTATDVTYLVTTGV